MIEKFRLHNKKMSRSFLDFIQEPNKQEFKEFLKIIQGTGEI